MAGNKECPGETVKWQHGETVIDCILHMLEGEIQTDVTFTVSSMPGGAPETFRAHKFMLKARSPVFYNMFTDELLRDSDNFTVDDVHPEAFRQMLRFIYCDDEDFEPEIAMHLLHVAKKYDVAVLIKRCTTFLKDDICTDNACIILDQALYFNDTELSARCLKYIMYYTNECLKHPSFLNIRSDTLAEILDVKVINCSEFELFNASCQWAEKKCKNEILKITGENLKKMLGNLLFKIHFTCLETIEFSAVCDRDILDKTDQAEIWHYIVKKQISQTGKAPARFSTESRTLDMSGLERTLRVDQYTATLNQTLEKCDDPKFGFKIVSDFQIYLKSITFAGVSTVGGDVQVGMKHRMNSRWLWSMTRWCAPAHEYRCFFDDFSIGVNEKPNTYNVMMIPSKEGSWSY